MFDHVGLDFGKRPDHTVVLVIDKDGSKRLIVADGDYSAIEKRIVDLKESVDFTANPAVRTKPVTGSFFHRYGRPDWDALRKMLKIDQPSPAVERLKADLKSATTPTTERLTKSKSVGRNDPCPCGCGRKLKKCPKNAF